MNVCRCILSKFYIKPQHERPPPVAFSGCILSKFYIKPQRAENVKIACVGCILSKFYIKPQRAESAKIACVVVSYRNSTSNHNFGGSPVAPGALYLIEILHQTTTMFYTTPFALRCILSKFYIKPQQLFALVKIRRCCILSKFYIKPQRSK